MPRKATTKAVMPFQGNIEVHQNKLVLIGPRGKQSNIYKHGEFTATYLTLLNRYTNQLVQN